MTTKLTLQDLKENKAAIIEYCNFYAHVPVKEVMQFMLDLVNDDCAEIKETETFEDFISYCYNFLKPRSRKVAKYVESIGRMEESGKIESTSLNQRYANKYGYRKY